MLDNRTGEWLAWEGSGDYFDSAHGGTIDGVIAPRQPGSALKPFTYAAAFERGSTPANVLPDVPSEFPTADPGVLYSPRNYDDRFRGPLLARTALAGSENVPAVALASEVGVPAISRLLRQVGFSTLDDNAAHYGLGLTLGNAEVRLDELVAAYADARARRRSSRATPDSRHAGRPRGARRRRARDLRTLRVLDHGHPVGQRRTRVRVRTRRKPGISISRRRQDRHVPGLLRQLGRRLHRDVTVGVWVGNFDRTPLVGSSGVTGAGPIFHAVMLAAVERVRGSLPVGFADPIVAPPADVERVEICPLSGMRAGSDCPTRVTEWLPVGSAGATCTWHASSSAGVVTVWPERYRTWAVDVGLLKASNDDRGLSERAKSPRHQSTVLSNALMISRPLGNAVFLLDTTLRPEFQALTLTARGGAGGEREWYVDGALVGKETTGDDVRWPLTRGAHQILVLDAAGASATTRIEVR